MGAATGPVLADQLGELVGLVFPSFRVGQRRFAFGDAFPGGQLGQLGVQGRHVALVVRHIFFGINRVDWALGDTDRAVDALIGVNRQEIGAFPKAVDWTDIDAVGVFALDTGFGNGMGHGRSYSCWRNRPANPGQTAILLAIGSQAWQRAIRPRGRSAAGFADRLDKSHCSVPAGVRRGLHPGLRAALRY